MAGDLVIMPASSITNRRISPAANPYNMKKNVIRTITRTVATASQLLVAAPVRLPPKVLALARYAGLAAALLEALLAHEEDERLQNPLHLTVDQSATAAGKPEITEGEEAHGDEP